MADIFISYASEDRDRAHMLAEALGAQGWSVWWDREIPLGKSFDAVIEKALGEARCLIVLWSARSVESQWVRSEASDAEARGILVPVFIEAVHAPLAFRLLNGANLQDWQPGSTHPEFDRLLARVSELLGQNPRVNELSSPPTAFSRRGHEPPSGPTTHASSPSISQPRVVAVAAVILGLLVGSYLLIRRQSAPMPAASVDPAETAEAPSEPGTRVDPIRGRPVTVPSARQTGAEAAPDKESPTVPTVGQVTLNWNGANAVFWKVLTADRKTELRQTRTTTKNSDSEDLPPGDYVVVLDLPGFQPIPVTVRAGQASSVTPTVGQVTFNWSGANAVFWKVLTADRKTELRQTRTTTKNADSEDLPPGEYVVAVDLHGFQPLPVTVRAGQASSIRPTVGQVTFDWNGANAVFWKVLTADRKTELRQTRTTTKNADSEDLPPGEYVVAVDLRGFQPIPVTVRAGQASSVTPTVGQVTFNWSGANAVFWKVLTADRKTELRQTRTTAKNSDSEDLPPGDYVVVLDLPGFQPIPVTVRVGQASPLRR